MPNNRRGVREAVYAELEDALDGVVPPENITTRHPDRLERYPSVGHQLDVEPVPLNTTAGPTRVTDTNDHIYTENVEGQFTILCRAESDSVAEDMYARIRQRFREYEERGIRDPKDLHEYAHDVSVGAATRSFGTDATRTKYGDSFPVTVQWLNTIEVPTVPIEVVDIELFLGSDSAAAWGADLWGELAWDGRTQIL